MLPAQNEGTATNPESLETSAPSPKPTTTVFASPPREDDGWASITLRAGRFEAFSDGVFAIAITILVLELSVPEDAENRLLAAFLDEWPSYLAYLVSFVTIGVAWLTHAAITQFLRGVDTVLVRLNLLLLLLVSFIPFPTSLVADHIHNYDAERVATTIFGINLLLIALVVSTMWRYAVHRGLIRDDVQDGEVRVLTERLTPALAAYVGIILLGFLFPLVAVIGYLALALALILPFGLNRGRRLG